MHSRKRQVGRALLATAILALPAQVARAQEQELWRWEGRLPAGKTIEVEGVVGSIRALPASGDRIEVVAEKQSARGAAGTVRMQVVEHAGGITICAIYPTPSWATENECVPGEEGQMGNFGTDVVVDFTVRAPSHVVLAARTAVGDIEGRELGGDVEANTTAGDIRVFTRGRVRARTVGGTVWTSEDTEGPPSDAKRGDIMPPRPARPRADLHAAPGALAGSWISEERGDRIHLALRGEGFGIWGRTFDRTAWPGLSDARMRAAPFAPVSFRIEREAGVFEMEGSFERGEGSGGYRFVPNQEFAAMLRSLPVRQDQPVADQRLMAIAYFSQLSAASIRELAQVGIPGLSVGEVIDMALHNVTPGYVRTMRALGVPGTSDASDLAEMRIHGVTPEYVRSLSEMGYRDLTARQLVTLRLHGVTPGFVRELRDAGLRDLSPDELVELKARRAGRLR